MTRARDLADSADKDIAGTLTLDGLTVDGAGVVGTFSSSNNNTVLRVKGSGATNGGAIGSTSSDDLILLSGLSERMRIDSSGNLLVGESSSSANMAGIELAGNGQLYASTSSASGHFLNIQGSSGNIASFRSAGATVGSIGTLNGNVTIGTGDTGVQFNQDTNAVMPHNISTGANVDASIDLGYSSGGTNRRFKDLYLSGDVYAGGIQTATAGTSNFRAGVNAGNSIASGGNYNTVIGDEAGTAITTGDNNTAVGYQAGYTNSTGSQNASVGGYALYFNEASDNSAFGYNALFSSTTGASNTAVGSNSLAFNTTGANNTAVGYQSLYTSTGNNNTAVGYKAATALTTATNVVAVGDNAYLYGTTGGQTVAVGTNALLLNTTGAYNVAVGQQALNSNTTASNNTAVGYQAGYSNTTGQYNTFVGKSAGHDSNVAAGRNTFVGMNSGYYVSSGDSNTILGRFNGNEGGLDIRTSSNNIVLSDGDGYPRLYSDANGSWYAIRSNTNGAGLEINNTGVYGSVNIQSKVNRTSSGGNYYFYAAYDSAAGAYKFQVHDDGDVVNTNNSYGAISDVKLKENIVDSGSQWDDIKALTVRKYSMKSDNLDAPNMLGVIAQEVEAAGMTGLVRETIDRDGEGNLLETSTKQVNYSILYMKAVKALQEAMDRIETLEAKVTALENA